MGNLIGEVDFEVYYRRWLSPTILPKYQEELYIEVNCARYINWTSSGIKELESHP